MDLKSVRYLGELLFVDPLNLNYRWMANWISLYWAYWSNLNVASFLGEGIRSTLLDFNLVSGSAAMMFPQNGNGGERLTMAKNGF